MTIEKKIQLKNNIYYIVVDVEYKKDKYGISELCIKDYKDPYYDGGDFSALIKKNEENYKYEKAMEYDNEIMFMGDVMYLYDRIPFLSGIRDVYIDKDSNLPSAFGYISKSEIDRYIDEHKVVMGDNTNFKLGNENTWKI